MQSQGTMDNPTGPTSDPAVLGFVSKAETLGTFHTYLFLPSLCSLVASAVDFSRSPRFCRIPQGCSTDTANSCICALCSQLQKALIWIDTQLLPVALSKAFCSAFFFAMASRSLFLMMFEMREVSSPRSAWPVQFTLHQEQCLTHSQDSACSQLRFSWFILLKLHGCS